MSLLSGLYGRAAAFRRGWYDRHPHRKRTLARPVISVGNLVVGGSGKTPLVAMLARALVELGERPSILSRGYGRRSRADDVVVVSDGQHVLEAAQRSGDEPQLLARALPDVPVLVSSERYLAGRLAEGRFEPTVHLLDDGFQHVRLARDVDLLVVSRADLDERVLPAGRLREDLAAAGVADAVLVPGDEADVHAVAAALACDTVFGLASHFEPLRFPGAREAISVGEGRRAVAIAGIARPQRFFDALRAEGVDVVREIAFRDHHWFRAADWRAVATAVHETGADLVVTTEKDAVRIETEPLALNLGVPLVVLPMTMTVEPSNTFRDWLVARLRSARARRGVAA